MKPSAENVYDHRGLSYEDYKKICQERGKKPLPAKEAMELLRQHPRYKEGVADWELSAYYTRE